MLEGSIDLYDGLDPVDVPAYTPGMVALYLGFPPATVRYWSFGRPPLYRPVILAKDPERHLLSFRNLVELHVLGAVRRKYAVTMPDVRAAVEFLRNRYGSEHPLADVDLHTDGVSLFVREVDKALINVSQFGQTALEELIKEHLRRIDRDPGGLARRLYPFTRISREGGRVVIHDGPKFVAIDPRIEFGRPCLVSTWTPTDIVVDRFDAGEEPDVIAADYDCPVEQVLEAIRYDKARQAA